jgi:hypothetical protein
MIGKGRSLVGLVTAVVGVAAFTLGRQTAGTLKRYARPCRCTHRTGVACSE